MLIQSPLVRTNGTARSATARGNVDHGGFAAALAKGRTTGGTSATLGSTSLAALGSLLMLQEDIEIGERRRRAVRRGNRLLDELEKLRRALLEGGDPSSALGALRHELAEEPGLIADPELQATLADIELRVAVEIAKLERDGTVPTAP